MANSLARICWGRSGGSEHTGFRERNKGAHRTREGGQLCVSGLEQRVQNKEAWLSEGDEATKGRAAHEG